MEVLLLAAAVALGLIGVDHLQKHAATTPGGETSGAGAVGQDPGPSGPGPGAGNGGGATAPPVVVPPTAQHPPATGPGLYPKNTPGTFPISFFVIGGDGDSRLTVTPGGDVGPNPGASKTFWYGPGSWVVVAASVDPLGPFPSPFTAFDHFEGPGVSTRQNPIRVQIGSAGYVKGVFAFMGRAG